LTQSAVAIGTHPSILDRLSDPAIRLVVWERTNPCLMDCFPESARPTPDEMGCLPDWLNEDIGIVGSLFARAIGSAWRVRLETAVERTCPRFHQDANALRFLTTYRGAGTEWTVDPLAGAIQSAATGAVVAVKGSAMPLTGAPVLHRSPKASQRSPRWVMAIDAA
jgi:hypothetical protein